MELPRFELSVQWNGIVPLKHVECSYEYLPTVLREETDKPSHVVNIHDTTTGGFFQVLHRSEIDKVLKEIDEFAESRIRHLRYQLFGD